MEVGVGVYGKLCIWSPRLSENLLVSVCFVALIGHIQKKCCETPKLLCGF